MGWRYDEASDTEEADQMAGRIVGGLSGWLVSLAPLVIVNVVALITVLDPGVITLAGGAGLLLGIALGGVTAGLLGGRRGGGGWGGFVAGALAAALFAATLIALLYLLKAEHQAPYLLALHPLRTIGAIGFVASLVMVVAASVGALAGRRQRARTAQGTDRGTDRRASGPASAMRPVRSAVPSRGAVRPSQPQSRPQARQAWPQHESRPGGAARDRGERSSRW